MAEPEFVAETLAWCNERRAEKGKPPLEKLPKGSRGEGKSCPCGKATELHVGQARFIPIAGDDRGYLQWFPLPVPVRSFVRAFDRGELPEYDVKVEA